MGSDRWPFPDDEPIDRSRIDSILRMAEFEDEMRRAEEGRRAELSAHPADPREDEPLHLGWSTTEALREALLDYADHLMATDGQDATLRGLFYADLGSGDPGETRGRGLEALRGLDGWIGVLTVLGDDPSTARPAELRAARKLRFRLADALGVPQIVAIERPSGVLAIHPNAFRFPDAPLGGAA